MSCKNRIHFIGYVSQTEKRALYAGATLFLYPSHYEGFGLPPLEAMASGVPVLISHVSSLPEVVGDAGVLLSPLNPNVWAEAIHWLINDESAHRDLSARGPVRAKKFSWQKSAESYYKLFKSII